MYVCAYYIYITENRFLNLFFSHIYIPTTVSPPRSRVGQPSFTPLNTCLFPKQLWIRQYLPLQNQSLLAYKDLQPIDFSIPKFSSLTPLHFMLPLQIPSSSQGLNNEKSSVEPLQMVFDSQIILRLKKFYNCLN